MLIQDPTVSLLSKVFQLYGVSASKPTIERYLFSHPAFLSISSISDTLDAWKIHHSVFELSLEELGHLGAPVIAKMKNGDYIWVNAIDEKKIHYWSPVEGKKTLYSNNFDQLWSGLALLIEDVADAELPIDTNEKQSWLKFLFVGFSVVLLGLLVFFSWKYDADMKIFPKILLLCFQIIGLYINCILLNEDLKQDVGYIGCKFCQAGKHVDCKKVTSSRFSTLFGIVSWAELWSCLFYF